LLPYNIEFTYQRGNPFYPALKALEILNGYLSHIASIKDLEGLSIRIERAANHVEELVSFTRKYINVLDSKSIVWREARTVQILDSICNSADTFVEEYAGHSKYSKEAYKSGGQYAEVVHNITADIREKIGN
jgi:hypothetical protein